MILKMFSVFDSKVGAYITPFFVPSVGHALRGFIEAASDSSNNICKYPADFTLFEIGEFDDSSCSFNLLSTPRSLGVAIELLPVVPV